MPWEWETQAKASETDDFEYWIRRLPHDANVTWVAGAAFKPDARNICFKLFPAPTHWWERSPQVLPDKLLSGSKSRRGCICSSKLSEQLHSLLSKTFGLNVFWSSEFSNVKRQATTCVIARRNYVEWIKPITKGYICMVPFTQHHWNKSTKIENRLLVVRS